MSRRSQPIIRGSSEGSGISPGVLDESTIILTSSSEGTDIKPGVLDEEEIADEEVEWLYSHKEEEKKDDDEDEKSINIENINDDKETDDEFVHGDECVHDDVDNKMKDAEVVVTRKDDEEITDAEKGEAEKSKEVKVTSETTQPHSYSVSTITCVLQQTTTPIPTPPITTEAPSVVTVPDLLHEIVQRESVLEKDVQELKQFNYYDALVESIRSQLSETSQKDVSEIHKTKQETPTKENIPKFTATPYDQAAEAEFKESVLEKDVQELKQFNYYDALAESIRSQTTSNARLRQYRVAIIWARFHKKYVDFAELIWRDFSYQIENMHLKKAESEIMPYPRFIKTIINHFLSIHKSVPKALPSGLYTIKDNGVLSQMKFVKIREDFQEYGRAIPETMLTEGIKQIETY
nr:hypothetical protein [Tanacetum cinerariifolium]